MLLPSLERRWLSPWVVVGLDYHSLLVLLDLASCSSFRSRALTQLWVGPGRRLTSETSDGSVYFWWILCFPWMLERDSVWNREGPTYWLHSGDQVSTGLIETRSKQVVSVLETLCPLPGISSPFYSLPLIAAFYYETASQLKAYVNQDIMFLGHILLAPQLNKISPFWSASNLNKITTRVPTHVPTSGVQSVSCRYLRRGATYYTCNLLIVLDPCALSAPLGPLLPLADRLGLARGG